MNWFMPLLFAFSFSVRTPSELPNPIDYELGVKMERYGSMYVDYQWEREDGIEFRDAEAWVADTFKTDYGDVFGRAKAREIGSIGLEYKQYDVRGVLDMVSYGIAIRKVPDKRAQGMAVIGYTNRKAFNILAMSGEYGYDMELLFAKGGINYAVTSKVTFGLLQNVDIYFLTKLSEDYNKKYQQMKVGIEIKLPEFGD